MNPRIHAAQAAGCFLQGLDTPLKDGDGVKLVPAIAGGSVGKVTVEGEDRCEQ